MEFLLGGDWRFFWPENIKFFAHVPYAWDSSLNTGLGIPDANTLWITSYLNLTASLSYFGLSWNLISIIFWIIPILLISFLSAFFLFRIIINKNNLFAALAGMIYTTNTYFLSIFLGGQIGVAFAYALIPFVFLLFYKLLKKPNYYFSISFALVFSVEVLFDPRFAFLTLMILTLYYFIRTRLKLSELPFIVVIPTIITSLLHSFWLLPLILFKSNIIPPGFDSIPGVKFFSFALFENSFSLLHPNWPENIFGKTYFMRPEFLLLPIIAFSSLLFKINKTILFFAILGLIGAFLGKGVNEPFGEAFMYLFENIPGFSVFRDPTKFFTFVALSYSILIPYVLFKISEKFKNRASLIVILFVVFWGFTLRELFLTNNLLKVRVVPQSYVQFKDFIVDQKQFFRTLWIPEWQRFGYFSDLNPAIGRRELLKSASASGMVQELQKEGSQQSLEDWSIKYVIVPEDSEGELFLEDRKYDNKKYQEAISALEDISWLRKSETFGKIVVFETPNMKDRFSSPNDNLQIDYKFINPTRYKLNIKNAEINDRIVFAEGYDQNWIAENTSIKYKVSRRTE